MIRRDEPDETVIADITGVTNATESGTQQVTVTITDDDAPPSLSVSDPSVAEGNSGTASLTFTVTLSVASGKTVTVEYATADGTATSGSDYTAKSGTLTFAPGETTKTVTVTVTGDTTTEASETVLLNLSGAVNATISDNQGSGTITNDDTPAAPAPAAGDGRQHRWKHRRKYRGEYGRKHQHQRGGERHLLFGGDHRKHDERPGSERDDGDRRYGQA